MRAVAGILMLATSLVACGPDPRPAANDEVLSDGGALLSGCGEDGDCPAGMLCEACPDGVKSCVPGCRSDAQCGQNMICVHSVQCLTCPCPSGWCDLDPCRDLDGDGWAAAPTGTDCGGKKVGDCDDATPSTRPDGLERCANGRDDDCDGRRDALDDECRDSCPGSSFCASSWSCGSQRWCDRGCCETCAPPSYPTCAADQCLLPGGLDTNGCLADGVCGACLSCSQNYEPVCGRNFSTYSNACLAQAAGTTVMHDGECDQREGMTCSGLGDCPYQQVCRAVDGVLRCARVGTCTVDDDCKAVTSVVSCGDAGVATWTCRAERCAATCP